jgi:hypothetical protein
MTESAKAIEGFPFVLAKGAVIQRLWSVRPTPDYAADNATGRGYAEILLAHMRENAIPGLLAMVIKDMRQSLSPWSGIEVGFFQRVAEHACAD